MEVNVRRIAMPCALPASGSGKAMLTLPSGLVAAAMEAAPPGRIGWRLMAYGSLPNSRPMVVVRSSSGRLKHARVTRVGLRGLLAVVAVAGEMVAIIGGA